MKKLSVCLLMVLIAFAATSQTLPQTIKDTSVTAIPNKDLRNTAFVLETLKARVKLANEKIDKLEAQIANLDANAMDYARNIDDLQNQLTLTELQRNNLQAEADGLRKLVAAEHKKYVRQKRKTVFVGIAGILASAFTFYVGAK